MKNHPGLWTLILFAGLSGFFSVASLQGTPAQATSDNRFHELGVYSLSHYAIVWKGTIEISYEEDPAGAFWDLMTSGVSSEYAHHTSRRRIDAEVNYHTVFPIPGDGWKDWDSFDMVFFYGHNNMITPPHTCESSHFYSNASGLWNLISGNWCDWGTPALPFEYYYMDVTDGATNPSAVVYLYDYATAALVGPHQFRPDRSWVIQTLYQDTPDGNTPGTIMLCEGGLGTKDLEWLILHGCQAVIVASEDGLTYNPMGVNAFRPAWDGFHLILGHYKSYSLSSARDLSPFADGLRTGMPVQAAYFLIDPECDSSAISAERLATYLTRPSQLKQALQNKSYMNTDTWISPKPDLNRSPDLWYVKWIRPAGTTAGHWIAED